MTENELGRALWILGDVGEHCLRGLLSKDHLQVLGLLRTASGEQGNVRDFRVSSGQACRNDSAFGMSNRKYASLRYAARSEGTLQRRVVCGGPTVQRMFLKKRGAAAFGGSWAGRVKPKFDAGLLDDQHSKVVSDSRKEKVLEATPWPSANDRPDRLSTRTLNKDGNRKFFVFDRRREIVVNLASVVVFATKAFKAGSGCIGRGSLNYGYQSLSS